MIVAVSGMFPRLVLAVIMLYLSLVLARDRVPCLVLAVIMLYLSLVLARDRVPCLVLAVIMLPRARSGRDHAAQGPSWP
jgi:hypothetical protein